MRSFVNLAAIGIALTAGIPAAADDSAWLSLGEDGWRPSLALTGGVAIQDQEASVESFCENGGGGRAPLTLNTSDAGIAPCSGLADDETNSLGEGMAALLPSDDGSDTYVSPTLGINLELMTPSIDVLPGDPRFFVNGEVLFLFGTSKNIANQGDPTGVRLPDSRPTNEEAPAFSLLGTGGRVESDTRTIGWGAGGGIAFPFEFLGRRIWVKPGAAWTQYTIDVTYRVDAGIKNDPITSFDLFTGEPIVAPNIKGKTGDQLRKISLGGESRETFNALGPSLEIEMDVGQFGPIGASLFVNGAAYRVLGNRNFDFSANQFEEETEPTTCCPTIPGDPGVEPRGLPADTYTANWTFEVSPWFYRANVGIRFSWFGF